MWKWRGNFQRPFSGHALALPESIQKMGAGPSPSKDPGLTSEEIAAASEQLVDTVWNQFQSDPIEQVKLIDKIVDYRSIKSQVGSFENLSDVATERLRAAYDGDNTISLTEGSISFGGLQELHHEGTKFLDALHDKLKGQFRNEDNASDDFEAWLNAEREKAAAECQALRASGASIDKHEYRDALAEHCGYFNTKATAFKALKACARCKKAHYCDAECQKKAWPMHKKVCKNPAK